MSSDKTSASMDMEKYHKAKILQQFFGQYDIEISDEFIERFEAFRAGVRASEDQWIIDNCTEQIVTDHGVVTAIHPGKVWRRMEENRKQEIKSFRQPWEQPPDSPDNYGRK